MAFAAGVCLVAEVQPSFAATDSAPPATRDLVREANRLLRSRRGREAIARYRRALVITPDHVPALSGIAHAYLRMKRYRAAAEWFRKLVGVSPRSKLGFYNLAYSLRKSGDLAAAVNAYRKHLKHHPLDPDTHYGLAVSLQHQGELAAAARHYRLYVLMERRASEVRWVSIARQALRKIEGRLGLRRERIAARPEAPLPAIGAAARGVGSGAATTVRARPSPRPVRTTRGDGRVLSARRLAALSPTLKARLAELERLKKEAIEEARRHQARVARIEDRERRRRKAVDRRAKKALAELDSVLIERERHRLAEAEALRGIAPAQAAKVAAAMEAARRAAAEEEARRRAAMEEAKRIIAEAATSRHRRARLARDGNPPLPGVNPPLPGAALPPARRVTAPGREGSRRAQSDAEAAEERSLRRVLGEERRSAPRRALSPERLVASASSAPWGVSGPIPKVVAPLPVPGSGSAAREASAGAGARSGGPRTATSLDGTTRQFLREGDRAFGNGQYRRAAQAYRLAARRAPRSPAPSYKLGLTYLMLGRFRDAVKALEQTLQVAPYHVGAKQNLDLARKRLR